MNNKKKSTNLSSFQKLFFVFFAVCLISFSPIKTNSAKAWDALAAEIEKQAMEELSYTVKGIVQGLQKQLPILLLTQLGMVENSARIITDWQDYIIKGPEKRADKFVNSYIKTAYRGINTDYARAMQEIISNEVAIDDKDVDNSGIPQWKSTYSGNPNEILAAGNLSELNRFVLDGNNAAAVKMRASEAREQYYQNKKDSSTAMAIANQGYDSKDGRPGILYKESQSRLENINTDSIINAANVVELTAAVVNMAVTRALRKASEKVLTKITN